MQNDTSGPICPQNYLTLYLKICHRIYFEISLFNTILRFWQNLGQNHTTLCPRMSHDSLSKKFEICCDGVKLHQSNSEFTQKIPFLGKGNLGQIWAKIKQHCLMIHSLKIFLKFCGIMRHDIDREK